jgi:hypothetical protein
MPDIRLLFCDQDETSLLHALEDRPWCSLSPVESDDGPEYSGSESDALFQDGENPCIFRRRKETSLFKLEFELPVPASIAELERYR